jgi:putative ATP-dependent endonuclease of OLD family
MIQNFKCFDGQFILKLNPNLNILVGDNNVGKSSIIEAINLALSGLIDGKYLRQELNQHLFNNTVRERFFKSVNESDSVDIPIPPSIVIEIFIGGIEDDSQKALFEGTYNYEKTKACGFGLKIKLNDTYKPIYEELIKKAGSISSLPLEYYDFHWYTFARDENLTSTTIPVKAALIDSTGNRYQNGSDVYISYILRNVLEDSEKIAISQAHRNFKDFFASDPAVAAINQKIKGSITLLNGELELSVDVSSRSTWETSLTTSHDKVPFHYMGKGEQTLLKAELALSHKKALEATVLLVEEPENHLSHTKLNKLLDFIKRANKDKQIIVSTHSSFVANKLGLGDLILLNKNDSSCVRESMPFVDLSEETKEYFEKLTGYDTLRFILCKSAILVEGDSDELVTDRAFMDLHDGKLPIQSGVEILAVGMEFKRFLEIAKKLKKRVAVITDTDGDIESIDNKYKDYSGSDSSRIIIICYDPQIDTGNLTVGKNKSPFNYNTLEPKILKQNGMETMNRILKKNYSILDDLHLYMMGNKTECALKIFKTSENISFPEYILEAISFVDNEQK